MLRTLWRLKHAVIGYTLLVLAVVQLVTGVNLSRDMTGADLGYLYGIYGACLGVAVVFAVLGLMLGACKSEDSGKWTPAPADGIGMSTHSPPTKGYGANMSRDI